ncbi:hypothetical protein ACIA5G_50235 [Amycolatopsis sp. NPDC051758]|uniref:hypothetical protein n=1 Tax=Amycolatopsis sp. NPDC051758 TaxID=3363935 RepID=UPI0037910CD2
MEPDRRPTITVGEKDLAYLLDYAREDWVGMSPISAVAGTIAGQGATSDELTAALLAVIGDLIDRGAVPGDLVAEDPGFTPWPGTKEERLRRIAAETAELGRLPETGEVAWLHDPSI